METSFLNCMIFNVFVRFCNCIKWFKLKHLNVPWFMKCDEV